MRPIAVQNLVNENHRLRADLEVAQKEAKMQLVRPALVAELAVQLAAAQAECVELRRVLGSTSIYCTCDDCTCPGCAFDHEDCARATALSSPSCSGPLLEAIGKAADALHFSRLRMTSARLKAKHDGLHRAEFERLEEMEQVVDAAQAALAPWVKPT